MFVALPIKLAKLLEDADEGILQLSRLPEELRLG